MWAPSNKAKEAEMNHWGFRPEDYGPDEAGGPTQILPCNWQAFAVFNAMSTQWRTGVAGPTGLDYSALPEVWRRTKTPMADRDGVFDDVQVMEHTALAVMHEKKADA